MCIKFKFLIYFSTLILVTFFTISNNGIEASKGTRNGRTCSSKESISLNTTYNENTQYQYTNSKKTKISQRLQTIISDIISKGDHEENKINDELKNIFSNTEETLSLRKQDVEIFATVMDEDTTVPVVTTFRTQSSSSSSQFDSNKFDSNKNISDDLNGGDESDLNETETLTFHSEKKAVQSDKLDVTNTTEPSSVNILQSPETPKVVNDTVSIADREDIPSFREWAEKHLAEEEKEKGDDNNTNVPTNGKRPKVRNKNYASLDCGAKLITTNPEAKSAGSLLSANRDEYLLSACNSKIWFVVELCETVQLKEIEIANFELFSSSPKEFSVLISDRFPSRDWTVVGQFVAKDEKSIQSFNLQPRHFTKYIKVEFHSHYGKEHFCPLSLFRVYGTSEFEVLETVDGNELENDAAESDDDVNEPIISDQDHKTKKIEPANNLFGSARDAVMNIVKKAAEALVKTPQQNQNSFNFTPTAVNQSRSRYAIIRDCVTPKYSVLCKQCSEEFFNKVYVQVSCYMKELHQMLQVDIIWKPLMKYNVCFSFGISPLYAKASSMNFTRSNDFYALRLLPKDVLAAFCNLIAISENKSKENITGDELSALNRTSKKCDKPTLVESIYKSVPPENDMTSSSQSPTIPFKIVEYTTFADESYDKQTLSSQIKPTKTLPADSDALFVLNDPAMATAIPNIAVFSEIPETETKTLVHEDNESTKDVEHSVEVIEDSGSLDSLISELEKSEDSHGASASQQTSTPKPHLQKESVFVRLANRIKVLERNMSLSGQYLEELSKRYKKQIEEAAEDRQKTLERESRRSQEINILSRHIAELTVAVDALVAERDSWSYKALMVGEHSLIIFLEIVIFVAIVCLCRGIPRVEISKRKFSLEWQRNKPPQDGDISSNNAAKRRQSLDDLNINKPTRAQKRRPSEEALKIDGSTHHDLLIHETNRTSKSENRRKRRKRKELLLKSNANAINLETGDIMSRKNHVNKITNAPLSRSASASEIDEHSWGRIDYTKNRNGEKDIIDALRQDENKYPPFFKTATSVRNKRLSGQLNGVSNLSPVYDVSSDQDSSQPSTPVKEKKVNGIKKIVKRFF